MVRRRKNKIKNKTIVGVVLIIVGLAVVGFSFSDTSFPPILPLNFLLERECRVNIVTQTGEVSPGDLLCRLNLPAPRTQDLPIQIFLPLTVMDINSPMILDFNFQPFFPSAECLPFLSDITKVILTDENGIIIFDGDEGITDIQPLLLPNQQTLILNFDDRGFGVCPTEDVRYSGEGGSNNQFTFFAKPPEITENTNPLLALWLYLGDFREQGVVEPAQNFAVAETFQLVDPTVITELRVMIGTGNDRATPSTFVEETTLTAFVWDIDQSPAKRIVQSKETFTGIKESRSELILDFTFPTSVVLLPTQNNVPINYAVGIKVEQNSGSEFIYNKSDQIADTHKCIIDRTANPDAEGTFVDNGLCGFDIRHSPFKAFSLLKSSEGTETEDQILDRLAEIENTILSTDDELTRTELTAILCEGITPQPAICQVGLTANSCGVTEFFFEGDCLCNAGYDRVESGDCELRDTSLLQIGDFTEEELVIIGIGLLILVIGAIAIAFARRR